MYEIRKLELVKRLENAVFTTDDQLTTFSLSLRKVDQQNNRRYNRSS